MSVSIENLGGIQRKVTLTIPVESIAAEKQKRLNDLSTKVRIDGFSRGRKIPLKIMQDRFGASVYSEVLNELINKVYSETLKAADVVPAGAPTIEPVNEKIEEEKPFDFTATFEVYPEIEIKDFSSLNIEKLVATVQESDIDSAILRVREQRATTSENGEKQLPELTDEFIASLGVQGGLEALRKEVRKNLERELKYTLKNKIKTNVIEQLLATHDFEIPKALIEREAERMREQSNHYFKKMNVKMKLPELPLDLFKENAKKNVKIGLLFGEILEKNNIDATPEKIDEHVRDMATMYDDVERAIEWIKQDKQQMENIRAQAREDMLVDQVLNAAKVTEKNVSYEELLKPNQAATQE